MSRSVHSLEVGNVTAMQRYSLLYLLKPCFKNLNFAYAGGHTHCFYHKGPPDFIVSHIVPAAKQFQRKHIQTGLIVDTGDDAMMGGAAFLGGGGTSWFEQFMFYDPHDKDSRKESHEYMIDAIRAYAENKWPGAISGSGEDNQKKMAASAQPEIYRWQRQIKEALDPNGVGDETYVYLKEP